MHNLNRGPKVDYRGSDKTSCDDGLVASFYSVNGTKIQRLLLHVLFMLACGIIMHKVLNFLRGNKIKNIDPRFAAGVKHRQGPTLGPTNHYVTLRV